MFVYIVFFYILVMIFLKVIGDFSFKWVFLKSIYFENFIVVWE